MDATLLIYSGRPNPAWHVEAHCAQQVEEALAVLPAAPDGASPYAGLGYSGVRVDYVDAAGKRHQAVFGSGIALLDGRPLLDRERRLERAVLASGRSKVAEIDRLF
ncbi:MAG TPA: hypothetical protein VGD66_00895 [Allosphingosinicella sp.]|jgi:hypothetical protein